jgi:stage V sporulation protein B
MQKEKIRNGAVARPHRLLSGVMVLTAANIIVKILGFFYKVPLNAVLGDEMANVNTAYAIYALLYTVSTAGVPSAVSLSVSRARAAGEYERVRRIFRVTVGSLLALGVFLSVLLILLARPLALWNSGGDSYLCLLAISPALSFAAANSVLRGYFQGFERMEPTAVSELLEAFGKTGFGLLFAFAALRLAGTAARTAAALAVFAITVGVGMSAFYLAIHYIRKKDELFPQALLAVPKDREGDERVLGGVLRLALPITAASAMMSASSLLDAQLMRPLLSSFYEDAALAKSLYSDYSTGALTLYNLPSILVTPLSAALIPYIAAALARGERVRAKAAMETGLRASALISLPCALGMSALSAPILRFVFRGDDNMAQNTGSLLSVLALAVFFVAVLTVTGAVLQAAKEEKKPLVSLAVGLGVKVLTLVLLTLTLGEIGVPLSTLFFYGTVTVLNLYFVRKCVGVRVRFAKTFLRPAAAALLSAASAWLSFYFVYPLLGNSLALVFAIALAALVYLLAVLLFRCVGKEELALLPFFSSRRRHGRKQE